MKHFLVIILFITGFAQAQIFEPVKWETSVEKVSESEFDLVITANIDKKWHLYSQNVPDGGPIPTTFSFKDVEGQFQLVGKTTEGEGHEEFDNVFEMNIKYFENQAIFKQRIRVLTDSKIAINETLEFMVCDDTTCLPPTDVDISFEVQGKAWSPSSENNAPTVNLNILKDTNSQVSESKNKDQIENQVTTNDAKAKHLKKEKSQKNKSLWTLFILSFFAGFAALLTPCVFPMIPMTVSFFTKQSKTKAIGIRNAIIFGLAIIFLYVLLGTVVTSIFGADSLNALATNVWFNIIFFLLLVIFAVSFMGAFEITLPSSWSTKVDSQADKGGFVGIFFMALALAIVQLFPSLVPALL